MGRPPKPSRRRPGVGAAPGELGGAGRGKSFFFAMPTPPSSRSRERTSPTSCSAQPVWSSSSSGRRRCAPFDTLAFMSVHQAGPPRCRMDFPSSSTRRGPRRRSARDISAPCQGTCLTGDARSIAPLLDFCSAVIALERGREGACGRSSRGRQRCLLTHRSSASSAVRRSLTPRASSRRPSVSRIEATSSLSSRSSRMPRTSSMSLDRLASSLVTMEIFSANHGHMNAVAEVDVDGPVDEHVFQPWPRQHDVE